MRPSTRARDRHLLAATQIQWALTGGLAMNIRGSTRQTYAVDMMADETVARLQDVLVEQQR